MRLSIRKKLMLAMLGLALIVLIATLVLARWSFQRGFQDYVEALEYTRFNRLSQSLTQIYIDNGRTWEGVDQTLLEWRISGQPGSTDQPPICEAGTFVAPSNLLRALTPAEGMQTPLPPTEEVSFQLNNVQKAQALTAALYDMKGRMLAGQRFDANDGKSINIAVVLDDATIAVLKSEAKKTIDTPIATAFSNKQLMTSLLIGVAALLFAALVSWMLVSLLLKPVNRMITSIKRLSKGDYSEKILEQRSDEFGKLMTDINHLALTLDKNQTSRKRWLADISHELRTPLAVLTAELEALKEGIRPFNQEQLVSLDQELKRVCHLTDDLYALSVSDIGGLSYSFSPMNLAESIIRAIKAYEWEANKKQLDIAFEGDDEVMISADTQRVDQLLHNLLQNAIFYTDAPGSIKIALKVNTDNVLLTINDTPPGVSNEECELLFEPLYRQDTSRSRRASGAGLGLSICRNIVEAHRGKIYAAPSALGGLQITINLPVE